MGQNNSREPTQYSVQGGSSDDEDAAFLSPHPATQTNQPTPNRPPATPSSSPPPSLSFGKVKAALSGNSNSTPKTPKSAPAASQQPAQEENEGGVAHSIMSAFAQGYAKAKGGSTENSQPKNDPEVGEGGMLKGVTDKFNQLRGKAEDAQEEYSYCSDLTYVQRIQGFVAFFVIGFTCNILAWWSLIHLTRFGILFTLGNVLSLVSTLFLMGPKRQFKKMFEEHRLLTTFVYLVSMVLTLLAAIWLQSAVLTIVCCVVQYTSFLWYCLSYIPGARRMAKKCGSAVFC